MSLVNTSTNKYQDQWESRSSIRTRPRKFIDFSLAGNFFPHDKQVILLLPEIKSFGKKVTQDILIQSLYKYLNDIVTLEAKLFHSVCSKIIDGQLVVNYTSEDKLNAHTIIIDEYYHVYVARDMILQLEQHFTDLAKFDYPKSDSSHAIDTIKNRLPKKYQDIFEIIAVCIFETTLVRELVEFFNSPDVHPSIKYYVNDHMNDEAKHYGFFYNILCHTWNNLPDDYREIIGSNLAEFVKLYLNIESEKQFNKQLLIYYLKDNEAANQLIDQIYHGFDITADIPIVKNVLGVLKKTGIMDFTSVKEQFVLNGLYV